MGEVDLSYVPPPPEVQRAENLRRQLVQPEPPVAAGSGWFGKPSAAEIAAQAAFLGLATMDWGQTANFARHGGREMNPLLGAHPSTGRINTLIPLAMAAHTLGAWALPRPYRNFLQAAGLGLETYAVAKNYQHGYKPTW